MPQIFDAERKSKELGISDEIYSMLFREVREEFPDDDMMFELHLIRALMAQSQNNIEEV